MAEAHQRRGARGRLVWRVLPGACEVVWTREEEFTWGVLPAAGVIEVKSGVASDGMLTAWDFHNYIPDVRDRHALCCCESTYGISSSAIDPEKRFLSRACGDRGIISRAKTHMDALARVANIDPLDFRMKNLSDPRLRAVLETAAKSFGWRASKRQEGQGFGVACATRRAAMWQTFAK